MMAVATTISERLNAARRELFVGRARELAFFQSALEADTWPCAAVHVCGPGGVGKTTLLHGFADQCNAHHTPFVWLDARAIAPSPEAFLEALAAGLGLVPDASPIAFLTQKNLRGVILVDAAEQLAPLDTWLRESFLPQLPDTMLVVLAGRHRPGTAWSTEAGWGNLVRTLALRNLEPSESRSYLNRRKVHRSHHRTILDFTHGHPLALVLIADLLIQGGSPRFEPLDASDVVRALLERFVQDVPGPSHRQALEACAIVRITTESLLATMLQLPTGSTPDAHDLFRWLQGLSFMESERAGIAPHDLAREVLVTELCWRNPDRYLEISRRAGAYYDRRLQHATGQEQRALLYNHVFLHRTNPAVRPFFEWQEIGHLIPGAARKIELQVLAAMVARHEGSESGQLAAGWFSSQPQGVTVIRDSRGNISGFSSTLALHQAQPGQIESDPAAHAVWSHIQQHAPLAQNEGATLFRFWMAHDTYQSPSPTQSMIFLTIMQHLLTTPDLAYTAIVCAEPLFWEPIFAYTDMARLPADFEVGGKRYGIYTHDWRARPLQSWLATLSSMAATEGAQSASPQRQSTPIVLSHHEFALEVRSALRRFQSPSALYQSPLLRSRLIASRVSAQATIPERAAALQAVIQEACTEIEAAPREAKSFRALFHTYLHGASTQEQAADALDMPFSTYRRHLTVGMARVVDILWQKEMDA